MIVSMTVKFYFPLLRKLYRISLAGYGMKKEMKTFNCGMWDKKFLAGTGSVHFDERDAR